MNRRNPSWSSWPHWSLLLGLTSLVIAVVAWRFPWTPEPRLYALRVQVVSPDGDPIQGSKVSVSAGNEPHLLPDGWWQVEIADIKLPEDRKVSIWAKHPNWAGAGTQAVLGADLNPRIEIVLRAPHATLFGLVLGASGRGISGARIRVLDYQAKSVETTADGAFQIELTAPTDSKVAIRAEHPDYRPQQAFCYLGTSCQVYLDR